MHQLKYGASTENIRKMAARLGRTVALKEPPSLTIHQQLLYTAFSELGTERQLGMSEGPIPWSSMIRYAEYYGYEPTGFCEVLRRVDYAYLEYQSKKLNASK